MNMYSNDITDEEWEKKAHEIALEIVENVSWPWTERQKRLWFIGVMAGWFTREALQSASMVELQEMHREITH